MPDLLSHALLAYTVATILSWRIEWVDHRYVTVAMVGAFIPDMMKIYLVVSSDTVANMLGAPFDWSGIHTLGGAVIAILIGLALVTTRERRHVAMLVSLGAGTHLFADALLLTPSGRSYDVLFPLTQYHPPTPGLYLSTQPSATAAFLFLAAVVAYLDRRWASEYQS